MEPVLSNNIINLLWSIWKTVAVSECLYFRLVQTSHTSHSCESFGGEECNVWTFPSTDVFLSDYNVTVRASKKLWNCLLLIFSLEPSNRPSNFCDRNLQSHMYLLWSDWRPRSLVCKLLLQASGQFLSQSFPLSICLLEIKRNEKPTLSTQGNRQS